MNLCVIYLHYSIDIGFIYMNFYLQIFAMEHIPKLASPIFNQTPVVYPKKFPLLEGWTELLCRRPKLKKENFLEIIESLDQEDVSFLISCIATLFRS